MRVAAYEKQKWYRWFAWRPVRTRNSWIWLEDVWRLDFGTVDTFWEYVELEALEKEKGRSLAASRPSIAD